ncbi:MAG TPA: LCP family protein [Fimbriimonadaceae bacterium]|nr:LCP family protein [Fimbriimonadaceae bacterium]
MDIGFGQVETNLRRTQVLALATIFKGSGTGNMKSATLPGDDDSSGEAYYYRLDEPRARAMVDWLIKHDGASYRSLTRVVVKNGSGKPGAARIAAEWLDDGGFQASSGGNAKAPVEATTIQFRVAAFEDAAKLVAKRLGVANVSKMTDVDPRETWKPEIEVVIGKDIVDSVLGQSP